MALFEIKRVAHSKDKPAVPTWDGTGKHPILGLTLNEIKELNVVASARQEGQHVDSPEKIKPDINQANEAAVKDAEFKIANWQATVGREP